MTLTNYKYTPNVVGAVTAVIIFTGSSFPAFAQNSNGVDANFCGRLLTLSEVVGRTLGESTSKIIGVQKERAKSLVGQRSQRDSQLKTYKATLSVERDRQYAKLDVVAKTKAQKGAVVAFKAAMDKALSDRATAVDAALQAYRNGVDQSSAAQQAGVGTAVTSFKQKVQAAFDEAEADCAQKNDIESVRQTLRSALIDAKNELMSNQRRVTALETSAQMLLNARTKAIDQAEADFTAAANTARIQLKATFAVKAKTTTTIP